MVKYIDNAWHAVKVAFGNEIGTLCKYMSIDSHQAMSIFLQDTKLNLSSYYLWPGFAFGGSCLPKDLRALTYRGRSADLSLPLLESVLPSNRSHINRAFDMIAGDGRKRVGISGLSFKAETDDLRESPAVELVERLIGKGFDVRIHDPDVRIASLVGANRSYILDHIGHISALIVETVEELIAHAQIIVLAKKNKHAARAAACARPDQHVIDLVRATEARGEWQYDGICW
jgi:GDP-mannose 6-dehydrogenase